MSNWYYIGLGGSGTISDCGYRSGGAMTACAAGYSYVCSSSGSCSGSPSYVCQCQEGYRGHDCSKRTCPKGRSWWGEAKQDNVAHLEMVECSNAVRSEAKNFP